MKRIILCLTVMLWLNSNGIGQGIYKTEADYINNKLSYTSYRVMADRPFAGSVVKLTNGKEVLKFRKSDLYGYQDKRKQDFRFFNNTNYRIVHNGPLVLYQREALVVRGKAKTREIQHFFSVHPQAPIVELNKNNLKNAWPTAHRFHDLLDLHFAGDKHLLKYDRFRGGYTLMHIFKEGVRRES